MLTAKEARERINSIELLINKNQLETIAKKIEAAVQRGDCCIDVGSNLTDPNKKHLASLGYTVTYESGDQRDSYPSYYRIFW